MLRRRNNVANTTVTEAMTVRTIVNNAHSVGNKKVALVPTVLMYTDEYQRDILTIKQLIKEWNDDKCQFLLVSERDGRFYVIDGQHRMEAAKAKGIKELPCMILTGLTKEEEARMFATQNRNVHTLRPLSVYKANLVNGDESIPEVHIDMEINRICTKYNVDVKQIGRNQTNPKILRSITRARAIVANHGSGCFEWIINVITSSNWNMCADAYSDIMMSMLRNYYIDNIASSKADAAIMEIMNIIAPRELLAMANYEFPEYTKQAALDLCLKKLIAENRETVAQ